MEKLDESPENAVRAALLFDFLCAASGRTLRQLCAPLDAAKPRSTSWYNKVLRWLGRGEKRAGIGARPLPKGIRHILSGLHVRDVEALVAWFCLEAEKPAWLANPKESPFEAARSEGPFPPSGGGGSIMRLPEPASLDHRTPALGLKINWPLVANLVELAKLDPSRAGEVREQVIDQLGARGLTVKAVDSYHSEHLALSPFVTPPLTAAA